MKIAYLVSHFSAASHTFIRREVAALRTLGTDISVFSVQHDKAAGDTVTSLLGHSPFAYLGALIKALVSEPGRFAGSWLLALSHRPKGIRALLWSQFHFIEAVFLGRMMRTQDIAHLHCHFANSGATVGMIAANYAGIPFSLTLHGISETDYPAGLLLPQKLERAAFVACASYFMQAQGMRTVADTHWPKFHIVRCGVDLTLLPEGHVPSRAGTAQLVCVGRLSPEKGYAGLFGALAKLRDMGTDFHLTVIGDGPSAASLKRHSGALKLQARVEFLGVQSEEATLAAIARADALVLPSLMEGLPVVLIEACALRKPVVASRVAGIPELINSDDVGLLFSPSDWDGLVTVLQRLLSQPTEWRRMGDAGRKRVEQEFTIQQAADRMAALFGAEPRQ